MKYNLMIGIAFFVCLFIFLPTVHADDGKMYQVHAETIEFMDAPSEDATILGELKKDYKVTIFEESNGWGKTFYNGEQAWIALHHLSAVDDIQTEPENEESDTEDTEDTENQQIETETAAEINTTSAESSTNGVLYRVQASAVNARYAPDKNAAVVTQLNHGEKVTIFEESYGWGKTYYHDEEVWIALYLLDKDNESTISDDVSEENETIESSETAEENQNEASEADTEQKEDETENEETESKEDKPEVQAEQSSEHPLADRHFVIDPGHGGKDPGAVGSEVYEKTLALTTAKKLGDQLRQQGASVTFTREDDTYLSLEERANISNAADTDAFISLHYNASEDPAASGVETFYKNESESQMLAQSVQTSLMNHVDLHDRGAQQADFQVLKDNQQTAILIELGFISNAEEQQVIQTDHYQENATKGIVAGLETYFN
ncbi:N-acetylmuramoyl-L-alanine amidase [Oceanobacillus timonensis]|uniref:N-acetylmuramoyl-L-alanine amidase n=1 Tax=Oceanobacillus timonensis TaxID=1926285 RepID=UPI0015C495A8|nr:N-acetylmuramoyl-L-alanine amidase [Oceanobacillus timonensis]